MVSANNAVNNQPAYVVRPVTNFSPSLWADTFDSFTWDKQVADKYSHEIEALKKEVRSMLIDTSRNSIEKTNLIDTLGRLVLSYHFEQETKEQLEKLIKLISEPDDGKPRDLRTVSLQFRLFRQHGYIISPGIFNDFTDSNERFKEELKEDVEGLLSLYEAVHLRIKGEEIMEEALSFARGQLMRMAGNLRSPLEKQVAHALEQSFHRGYPRIEARYYISTYEEDEAQNEELLRLAKLDYNLLQMLYKQELCDLSRWWKNLDLVTKLEYPRDRMVECYFWALGVYFEPQYSLGRIMLTKTLVMISLMDDTYDAYGTIEELSVFTEAVQRWNIGEIDKLPSNELKICYGTLLKVYEEFEGELAEQGRSYAVYHAKEAMKRLVRNYYTEAKWFIEGYLPKFNEYMAIALVTSTYYLMMASCMLGMKSATREAYDWLTSNPKIVEIICIICRIVDDVATYEVEKERGQLATGIECYMNEYGVSKKEAYDKFHEIAENSWIDLNSEMLQPTPMPMQILMRAMNLVRILDVTYKHDKDGYTHPEKILKPYILSLVVDPVTI